MLGWIKRRSLLAAVLAVPFAVGALPGVAKAETVLRVITAR